jgi:hypothetical protein
MLLHQDGSTHEWVPGQRWDLIVTMDDATNEPYSMFFIAEEGTLSSLRGVREVITARGLSCALCTDRGSHYWTTPEAGGKVDRVHLTQFGEAMKRLGIEMIPAYSPEARGRSERAFATHQARLPKELALAGLTDMAVTNRYLEEVYRSAFNREFAHQLPGTRVRPPCPSWAGTWMSCCASSTSARSVGTTACVSKAWSCRFRLIGTAVTTSRLRCASIAMSMGLGRVSWPAPLG